MNDRLTDLQTMALGLYEGKDPDEWVIDDDYLAVLPLAVECSNGSCFIVDNIGVQIAGPMGSNCASRLMRVIEVLMPKEMPLLDLLRDEREEV